MGWEATLTNETDIDCWAVISTFTLYLLSPPDHRAQWPSAISGVRPLQDCVQWVEMVFGCNSRVNMRLPKKKMFSHTQ